MESHLDPPHAHQLQLLVLVIADHRACRCRDSCVETEECAALPSGMGMWEEWDAKRLAFTHDTFTPHYSSWSWTGYLHRFYLSTEPYYKTHSSLIINRSETFSFICHSPLILYSTYESINLIFSLFVGILKTFYSYLWFPSCCIGKLMKKRKSRVSAERTRREITSGVQMLDYSSL